MRRIVFVALAMLGAIVPTHAQQATAVSSCGGITYDTAGQPYPVTQDLTGKLCTAASVSGGPTAANQTAVQANPGSDASKATAVQGVTGGKPVQTYTADPCSYAAKSSVAIAITSATTTSFVPVSGSLAVYVCGFSFTIAPSATSADNLVLEYGTGAACTSPTVLTGGYGKGNVTTTVPNLFVSRGNGTGTILTAPSGNGICGVSTGTTVNIQGELTYVYL